MTSPGSPVTACDVLFGGVDNAARALARAVTTERIGERSLRHLSLAARDTAVRELSVTGADVIDLDLGSLLVSGWRKYSALLQAARRTAAEPGSREVVEIRTQRIGAASHPSVELLVDEVRVATVHFGLTLDLVVRALAAVVTRGAVVALTGGRCETTAALAIEGVTVASRTAEHDLRLMVHLGNGIPLIAGGPRHV
jgi:hypothetical protein